MELSKAYVVIASVAGITFIFRLLPFIFCRFLQGNLGLEFVQKFLPAGIMLILTLFTLQGAFEKPFYGMIEFGCVLLVVVVHVLWRNALASIGIGTAAYVFALSII